MDQTTDTMDRSSATSLNRKSPSPSDEDKTWEKTHHILTIVITVLVILLICLISYTLIFLLPGSSFVANLRRSQRLNTHQVNVSAFNHSLPMMSETVESPVSVNSGNSSESEDHGIDTVYSGNGTEMLDPVIESKSGLIIGTSVRVENKIVNSFLGIPYAVPPVADLRFKRPESIPSWGQDALEAKNFSDPCVQFVPSDLILTPWISERNTRGSEDCLYLNIWAPEDPEKPESELKAVMVWLHGGAFFSGSSDVDLYNGQVLAAVGDVVVVSLNYRLGALGFLATNWDDMTGNMGMYDQALALQWIKENAESFGGDPENIVLFGQSAGATSAGLHIMSPVTRDIPSRVILQSGGPLFPQIYFQNQIEKSNLFVHEVGCGNETHDLISNSNATLDCLMNLTIEEIANGHKALFAKYKIPFFPHPGDDFLPDLPHDLIHDPSNLGPQTEILVGNNEDEGSFFLHLFFPQVFTNSQKVLENFTLDDARQFIAKAYSFIPENEAQVVSQFFLSGMAGLKNSSTPDALLKATHDIIGDSGFVCPAVLFSELMSEYNVTVYHYLMNSRPSQSKWSPWMGMTHMDEVEFVFGLPIRYPDRYTREEQSFSRQLIHTWTTFARTGSVPVVNNSTWPVYHKDSPEYLELNCTSARVKSSPHKQSCNLWKIIYDSFM